MERWRGKVALVTGASAGIGAAISRSLAKDGMKVVGVARNVEAIEKLSQEVPQENGGSILPIKCDLTVIEEIDAVFETVKKKYGGVDVCINNAGFTTSKDLLDGTPEEWRGMSDVNVIALCYCSKLATQSMVERNIQEGHIINISSVIGHMSKVFSSFNFYGSTKHAVKFLTEGLRQEMIEKKHNIRVTAISPGAVETEFGPRALAGKPEMLEAFKNSMTFLTADSIADAVTYVLKAPNEVEINDIVIRPTKGI